MGKEILWTLYKILQLIGIWRHIWEFFFAHAYSRITLSWYSLDGATSCSKQLSVLWQCWLVLRKGFLPVEVPLEQEQQTAKKCNEKANITRSSAIAVIADRTACSILTLFIVTATSRPLNKKSVCCQSTDPTITADLRPQSAVRTPLSAPVGGRTMWPFNGTVSLLTNEPTPSLSPIDTYGVSSACQFIFCAAFCD